MTGLRTTELASATGASFRQLDYWARMRILVPKVEAQSSGTPRLWDEDDIPTVRALVAVSILTDRPTLFRLIGEVRGPGPWSVEQNGVRLTVEVERL